MQRWLQASPDEPMLDEVLSSPGQRLDTATRSFLEPRFGHDLSRLQVHTDAKASASAEALGALAYTRGSHLVFAPGRYQPRTPEGRSLLAHEVVHVLQQASSPAGAPLPVLRKKSGLPGGWVTEEPAGGCGVCYGVTSNKPAAAAGTAAHRTVQAAAQSYFGRYARPELHFRSPTDENGFLDLLVATPGGFKIAEIKPSNPQGEKAGLEDIRWYKQKMEETFPDKKVELLDERIPVGQGLLMPDPIAHATGCAPQKLGLAPMRLGVYGYWCAPSFKELRPVCSCRPPAPPVRVPKPEPVRKPATFRVRLVGAHPYFQDEANRLPYMEAPPGRELIVVIEDQLFKERVSLLEKGRMRPMVIDPRGVPRIQMGMVYIPTAMLAAVVIGGIGIAALVVLVPLVVSAAAGAVATATATSTATAAASSGVAWTVGRLGAAAAGTVIANLVAGGISDVEAAEAVKPYTDKPIVAVGDLAARADLASAKPGQEVSVGGQVFRAIIRLRTPEE
jgi:hypothetical protein